MNPSKSDQRKRKLLEVLTNAQASAGSLKERAQTIGESAGFAEGLAQHLRPVIEAVPDDSALPGDLWADLTGAWEAQNKQATAMFTVMPSAPSSSATTAAATLTTTASARVLSGGVSPPQELRKLRSYLHRPTLIEEVRRLAGEFGLDHAHSGGRSALQLLEEAADAMARPATVSPAPTAVLITARESIQTALASLLQRRPIQEAAGKASEKVVSIGRQCGRSGLPPGQLDRVGRDLGRLIRRLSEGKERDLAPSEVAGLFDEVLQFFMAFLSSLDPSTLRQL